MKTEFTPIELKEYFVSKREERWHYFRKDTIRLADALRVHADGSYPKDLIDERRPNETNEVKDYRKKIFIAKTKPVFSKIESTLQKIRRSSDWMISYKEAAYDKIVEDENLEAYCEKNFPIFTSLTNWCFSVLLRTYLIDANALVLVAPKSLPLQENEFIRPEVMIFNSEDVIDYIEGDYAVLVNKTGAIYYSEGTPKLGESYYIITTERVERWDQINGRKQFAPNMEFSFDHGLELLPVFKVGGIVVNVFGPHVLYESRISGIVPEFNEALREYSDLQAAKVLHLFPERWEYTQNECTNCKGAGRTMGVLNDVPCDVTCNTCQGRGYVATGPYNKMLIRPKGVDEQPLPTPPAGFVEKDVEIIKVQEKGVMDHIYYGLASINFEFLSDTPLNQSGKAKEVDKDELNTTVHSIAEDIVRILDRIYYIISLYRYSIQYSRDEIAEMKPAIAVPEKFDIISALRLEEQLASAKKNSFSPEIIKSMEVEYAYKVFNNTPEVADKVWLLSELDPLAGISEDDKMSRLSNNGITQLDYVTSSNINSFVDKAIETTKGFAELDIIKQREIIKGFAEEQMTEQDEAKKITADVIEIEEPLNVAV